MIVKFEDLLTVSITSMYSSMLAEDSVLLNRVGLMMLNTFIYAKIS